MAELFTFFFAAAIMLICFLVCEKNSQGLNG